MKWGKVNHFGSPYYFSGVYKLASYTWYKNREISTPYWCAYIIRVGQHNWGDFVPGSGELMTLEQAKKACEDHAAGYTPTPQQSKKAAIAQAKWVTV